MVGFLEEGMGVAPIDAKTGRERLSGQESSVFQQAAPGPRVAGPQGAGGDQPGDKTLDEVNAATDRGRAEEKRRKAEWMKEPAALQVPSRKVGKNAWDKHAALAAPASKPTPAEAEAEYSRLLAAGKAGSVGKNPWDKHTPLAAANPKPADNSKPAADEELDPDKTYRITPVA